MIRLFTILCAAILALPATAAANEADLYVVHGINGMDLGLDEAVAVDVSVDGACAVTGFEFKNIVGPVTLAEGPHTVIVSLSDGACGGGVVIDVDIDLPANRMLTAVAHLDTSGAPTASLFLNNQGFTAPGFGKVLVRHTSNAPAVDVSFRPAGDVANPGVVFPNQQNGWQAGASLSAGNWRARIFPSGNTNKLVGPVPVPIKADHMLIIYALGSLSEGTFELLVQEVALGARPGE